MIRWRTDNPTAAVLDILRSFPIGPDAGFRGELARLRENRSFRMHYRKTGVTLDAFGEILIDRGLVAERPSPDDLVCYFDDIFRTTGMGRKRAGRKTASVTELEKQVQHARNVRFRLYECSCGQKIRGTRSTSVICGLCYEMEGEIRMMVRKDALPEEILAQTFETMQGAA